MRKITLIFSLLLCSVIVMAQGNLELKFKKTSATAAEVIVTGSNINATGITATITSNYDWKTINGNTTFHADSVLCPDKNTKDMTEGNEGYFYITLNGVPSYYSFGDITFTSCALMSSGAFQTHSQEQQVNFTLNNGDAVLGTKENISIKVNSNGGEAVVLPFDVTESYVATDDSLSLTLKLAKGTTNDGCFYGLTKISIETTSSETDNTVAKEALGVALTNVETLISYIGTGVGKYSSSDPDYETKYQNIKEYYNSITSTNTPKPIEIEAKTSDLEALIATFSLNLPEDGKVYRIKNVINNYSTGNAEHYIANATNMLPTESDNSTTLWVCQQSTDGNARKFISVLGDYGFAWQGLDTAVEYTVGKGVNADAYKLVYNNMNLAVTNEAQRNGLAFNKATNDSNKPNNIVQADCWSTDFVFEEVTDYTGFTTTIAQGSNGNYGTLNLPFAVTIPEGVTVHGVTLSDNATYLKTTDLELTNNILPVNTPVLLKGTESGSKAFTPAPSYGLTAISTGFSGTLAATSVTTANTYYILAFEGEAGSEIKFFELDGTDNTVNANKAYYVATDAQASRALSIDFAGATGIDEVKGENEEVNVIYDLTGRRIEAITVPGIYIVNGNKVLVK